MIKALLLIFEPVKTWDNIALARRGMGWVLFVFLTPLLALTTLGETLGLIHFGKEQELRPKISQDRAIHYGIAEFILGYALVFLGAKLVKAAAETFHRRNTYTQCFNCVAYALSPLFLLHLLNILPGINPWISFGIGIVLSVSTLYSGLPRVLQPDPPQAFGLYVISSMFLAGTAGLAQFLSWLILAGRIKSL